MSFTKSYAKLTLLFAGFAVATCIATFFNAPTAHAANPKWLNRQDITMDGAIFTDPNTLDNNLTYFERTTRQCKSRIFISGLGGNPANFPKDSADKIFYFDSTYNGSFVERHLVTQREFTNPLSNRLECQDNPSQRVTIDSPENRRVVFIEKGGEIINLITGARFVRVSSDFAGNIPRYVSVSDRDAGQACMDLIVRKAGSSDDYENEFRSAQPSSVLYIVGPNGGESSPSYNNVSGNPNPRCNVESQFLNAYGLLDFHDSSDTLLSSAGFDANGNIQRSTYDFDAFLIFVGDTSNEAVNPVTGGTPPPPGAPPVSTLQPVCEDDASGLANVLCPAIEFVQDAYTGLFNRVIKPFLGVAPVGTVAGLDALWRNILAIANIAFIVVFFIIIFSQATSIGITNYGIKRMLPRLIIVAILSNLSLYICAFLVDVFNILGLGISSLILIPLSNLPDSTLRIDGTWAGWLTTLGGITWAGSALAASGGILAGVFSLVVIIGIALIVLVIMLLLRQVLIFTYIAFSPLIFIGFILPGTARFAGNLTMGFVNLLLVGPAMMAGMSLSALVIIIIENLP